MTIKDTSIRQRKNGLYELRYYENNKQVSIYARSLNQLRIKYNKTKNKKIEYKKTVTLAEWYAMWLEKYKKPLLKQSSLNIIQGNFKNHILPFIGDKELNKITEDTVQKLLNQIKNKERTKTLVYIELNDCLNKAIPTYIETNPCKNVVIKKYNGEKGKALTRNQQNELIDYLERTNHKLKNIILFYIYTGTRLNEALNLRLEDVDFENKTIHIKGTKTSKSNRTIPVNEKVLALMEKTETPFNYQARYVQKGFKEICNELKFENITIHSLRHTFVTRCIEKGIKLTTIQKWVGHSSIKITSDIYGEIQTEFEREELDKLN